MKKSVLITIIVISLVILSIVGFLGYSGFFSSAKVEEKEMGPFYFVGIEYVGDYKNVSTITDTIYRTLEKMKIKTTSGFGIYRDDPAKVEKSKLRSMSGCVVEEKDTLRKGEIERTDVSVFGKDTTMIMQKMNRTKCMVVEFPYKNQFSIIAGIMKAYPVLNKYIKEKGYNSVEAIEIYDISNSKITYLMEIKQ